MSIQKYDAIIIGGGHNGLTTAAYLAKAGWKVLVLEQRHILGGAAVTEEVYPGFKFTVFSYVVSLLRPEVIRELNLAKHGLHIMPLETAFVPMENGDHLALYPDPATNRESIQPPFGPRCRHLPRIQPDHVRYGFCRQTHFGHGSPRPNRPRSGWPAHAAGHGQARRQPGLETILLSDQTDDHERLRFSG